MSINIKLGDIPQQTPIKFSLSSGNSGGGTSNYRELLNLPQINGVTLVGNKTTSDLNLPTQVSDLANDLQYQTYQDVASIIASIPTFSVEIVEVLPEVGSPMKLYLVPREGTQGTDVYDEYVWVATSETFELVGSTAVDLTGYIKNTATSQNAIGILGSATSRGGICIGANALCTGSDACQLGTGNNYASNTLQFRSYRLLDGDGKIPEERLSNTIGDINYILDSINGEVV